VTISDENGSETGRRRPDGISCVGLLLLIVVVLTTVGVGLGGAAFGKGDDGTTGEAVASETTVTATVEIVDMARVTQQASDSKTASDVLTETTMQAATSIPTATPTSIPTATSTPTQEPGPSAVPVIDDFEPHAQVPTATPDERAKIAPLPTPLGVYSWTLKVPILMYHYVSEPPEGADKYRLDLSVHPEAFRQQMHYLAENEYSPITFDDLSLAIVDKRELPPKPVIITLDDGYRDNYENALPVLRELGFTATIFVVTDFVDQGRPEYLSWEMIAEMAASGIRFEPHTKTHPDLTEHDRDFIIYEIQGSGETLEAHLGYRSRYFAYPSGRYNDDVIEVLSELEYWGAVTTAGGLWHGFDDRYEWTRVRVRNLLTLEDFADLID
jgi:peptidoglycan/xylan/chitin deacetylase (PgdA/CDA1 family)